MRHCYKRFIKGTSKDGEVPLKMAQVQQARVQAWRSRTESERIGIVRSTR